MTLGTRTFAYNGDLQLETETVSGTLYSKVLTREYEDGSGVPGRFAGLMVGTAIDPDADYAAGFFYDAVGRPNRVTGPGLSDHGAVYGYLADSGLIERLDYKNDDGTATLGSAVRSYEPQRDLITAVQNDWGAAMISRYAYESDALGRRDSVLRTGQAFGQTHFDLYDYNPRNELIDSDRYDGTDPENPNPMDLVDTLCYDWEYDPIGNREEYTAGTNPTTYYTANNVNQYTATTDPTESFMHDGDGNMTTDGTLTYVWDGENRLISVAPASSPVEGDKMLTLTYDYRGRRVRKVVDQWSGSAWQALADVRFVWDGWLLLLELDGLDSNTVIRKYAWGLDLSGSRQGAAGIGGLLATHDASTSKNYAYFYDANGNVGQLIDTSDGSIDAHYEYDPYGDFLASTGIYATINPFCFSTKYLDTETSLYYYGYRYYSPRLGRWLSRDPIGSRGGLNAYEYVTNAPTVSVDPTGLRFRGGATGNPSRLWWFGGTAGRGQQGIGSIQKEVPPKFERAGCCCRIKPGTGYALVERTYDTVLSGDQGVSNGPYHRGQRGYVSSLLASHLNSHEQAHVDATRRIHDSTISVAEARTRGYSSARLCCPKDDACAILKAHIAWNHWMAEFRRLDQAVNGGAGLLHNWETRQGGGPTWGPLPAETIRGVAYGVVYRSRAENPKDSYRLPNYSAFEPPAPTQPALPKKIGYCHTKLSVGGG